MSTRQAPYPRSLAQIAGTVLNVFDFAPGGDPTAVTDWWDTIRTGVQFVKDAGGGKLIFPAWDYEILYDAGDATRTASTGVIDLSPFETGSPATWVACHDIEIRFERGARLLMNNLMPNGYDAQTHAVFAQCHWTDAYGVAVPDTWTGYAVRYYNILLSNVRVEWATKGSARGIGDAFHFAGTKSSTTAPYGITLDNCHAKNAPQVGTIFMGCSQVHVTNFRTEENWADSCHFNACFEGCTAQNIKAVNCGDDTLAVVTYYPDVITLALGLDTEVGPFTSPDQLTANNNGLQATNIQMIGGRANAVRLLGANRACITNVYADAAGSSNLDAAVWAGSVKANGTTLAQSGMANVGCQVSQIVARNGVQVGVHLPALGFTGSEGDDWLLNDVTVRGVNASGCAQVSVWGHDCYGFTVDGVRYDSTMCDFTNVKNIILDNFEGDGELNITAASSSYATSDMDTMPWHNIHLGSIRINGSRMVVTDTRGLTAQRLAFYNSPASSFEGIRLADFTCPDMRIVMGNRSGTAALANIPVRCIPGHRWAVTGVIVHDSTNIQAFLETGGGTAYNVSQDNRIRFAVDHSVSALGDDPWEVETGTYAVVNLWRQFRVNKSGALSYINTDDLPLGIVPEITASSIAGTRTLKIYDAIAVFATGVLSGLSTALSNLAAVFGAREIRFMQFGGDEGSAGVIDYGEIQADALSIHGKGTLSNNRKVRVYDNLNVNGTIDAVSTVTAPDVKVTNTTGSQPARLDSDKLIKGGKIDLGNAGDVSGTGMTTGSLAKWDGTKLASASYTADRVLGTDGSGVVGPIDVDLGNASHVTVPGSHGDILYNNGGTAVAAISLSDLITALRTTLDSVYVLDSAYSVHTHDTTIAWGDHTHGGGSIGPGTTDGGGSGSDTGTSTGPS